MFIKLYLSIVVIVVVTGLVRRFGADVILRFAILTTTASAATYAPI